MPTNEYMRAYLKGRHTERRARIVAHLGGKCVRCGAVTDLEVDHVDRAKKTMDMTTMVRSSWDRTVEELKACQLLCGEHHDEKSVLERGNKIAKGTHGTISAYRWCRCNACRAAKNANTKEYRYKTGRRKKRGVA